MADDLVTAQDMIDRLDGGVEELRRFAGDDGTGNYSAPKVATAIATVSKGGYAILRAAGWTNAQIVTLVAEDEEVKSALCQLVRFELVRWKNEFRFQDGSCMFARDARDARDVLRQKASNALRTTAEENTAVGPSALNRPRACAETPPSTFFRDPRSGRPVGF